MLKPKLSGAGVRDSCGKSASKGGPHRRNGAEGGPPAERECPTFQDVCSENRRFLIQPNFLYVPNFF
ncbi:hypothetical protein RCO48_01880 [Peribacillus frigoritolerans]|nr:hypothetical protein [Peribacillus frigoritolerans]